MVCRFQGSKVNERSKTMIQLCTCASRPDCDPKFLKLEYNEVSCRTCGGKPLLDGKGDRALSANLLGVLGLELKKTAKIFSKSNRRTLRRARNSTLSVHKAANVIDIYSKWANGMPISESEKLGVSILGRRFTDNLDSVPIKKRRLAMYHTPLLSPYENKLVHHKKDEVSEDETWTRNSTPLNQRALDGMINSEEVYEVIDECIDFSGISILAAVACNTDVSDADKRFCSIEHGSFEMLPTKESCSIVGESHEDDLSNRSATSDGKTNYESAEKVAISDHSKTVCQTMPPSIDLLHERQCEDTEEKTRVESSSSRNDRSHWDLNTDMDAWDCPLDDSGNSQIHDHSNHGDSLPNKEALGNFEGCALSNRIEEPDYASDSSIHHTNYGASFSGSLEDTCGYSGSKVQEKPDMSSSSSAADVHDQKETTPSILDGANNQEKTCLMMEIKKIPFVHVEKPMSCGSSIESVFFVEEKSPMGCLNCDSPVENSTHFSVSLVNKDSGSHFEKDDNPRLYKNFCLSGISNKIDLNDKLIHVNHEESHQLENPEKILAIQVESSMGTEVQVGEANDNSVPDDRANGDVKDSAVISRTPSLGLIEDDSKTLAGKNCVGDETNCGVETAFVDVCISDFDSEFSEDESDDDIVKGKVSEVQLNDDSQYEDGELRESDLHNWEEAANDVWETEQVDYESDSKDIDPVENISCNVGNEDGNADHRDIVTNSGPCSLISLKSDVFEFRLKGKTDNDLMKKVSNIYSGKINESKMVNDDPMFRESDVDNRRSPGVSKSVGGGENGCKKKRMEARLDGENSVEPVKKDLQSNLSISSHFAGTRSSDMPMRKDKTYISVNRSGHLHDTSLRPEGVSSISRRHKWREGWLHSSSGHPHQRHYPSSDKHDVSPFGQPVSENPASIAAKLESNGFAIAPDGTIVRAVGSRSDGLEREQPIKTPLRTMAHRSSSRGGMIIHRDRSIGCNTNPEKIFRARDRMLLSRVAEGNRRERSFSPVHERIRPTSPSYRRSVSRSRTPETWIPPRGGGDGRNELFPCLRDRSRSPLTRLETRKERARSPHISKWIDGRKEIRNSFKEISDRHFPRKIPPHSHNKFESMSYHRGPKFVDDFRSFRTDEAVRRKHGHHRYEMVHRIRRYDVDRDMKRPRYDVEDSSRAFESHENGPSKFRRRLSRDYYDLDLENAPRRSRDVRGSHKYVCDT